MLDDSVATTVPSDTLPSEHSLLDSLWHPLSERIGTLTSSCLAALASPTSVPAVSSESEVPALPSRPPHHDGRCTYPRIVTAWQLLEEEDPEPVFCGPPSDSQDIKAWEARSLEVWGIARHLDSHRSLVSPSRIAAGADDRRVGRAASAATIANTGGAALGGGTVVTDTGSGGVATRTAAAPASQETRSCGGAVATPAASPHLVSSAARGVVEQEDVGHHLLMPRGEAKGDHQKFICVFAIGLEDDQEFCLVKRILGKGGNNMRRIAEEFNAKIRLRGIGSGFLEGADKTEANMPLQLNVSCVTFEEYCGAVQHVETLLTELYKHYRRYARSRHLAIPYVKVSLEELRRDDWPPDKFKALKPDLQVVGEIVGAMTDMDGQASVSSSFRGRSPLVMGASAEMFPGAAAGRRAAQRMGGAAEAAQMCAQRRELERRRQGIMEPQREQEELFTYSPSELERGGIEAHGWHDDQWESQAWAWSGMRQGKGHAPVGSSPTGSVPMKGTGGRPAAMWMPTVRGSSESVTGRLGLVEKSEPSGVATAAAAHRGGWDSPGDEWRDQSWSRGSRGSWWKGNSGEEWS